MTLLLAHSRTISRRRLLQTSAAGLLALGETRSRAFAAASDLVDRIASIERETIFRGSLGPDGKPLGKTWFSTRCGMIPGKNVPGGDVPTAVMLMAEIRGSDYFEPVHETVSRDLGRTWSTPNPVPGLGRTSLDDGHGTEATVCDMVPEYHPQTGAMLAMGHDVFYRNKKFFREGQPPRHTVYIVRRADGTWSSLKRLAWNDPRGAFIYTCNCAQRITLDDGDVLVPLSVGANSAARSVVVVRCGFDGEELTVRESSNELKNSVGRGLLEPSLVACGDTYYLTIRAEDNHGYVSTSTDQGRTWTMPTAWTFDDGTPIAMSTTQRRWLVRGDVLYLIYTRKDASNTDVLRWRAPLFASRVDLKTLRLIRETERIAVPLVGDGVKNGKNVPHLGNFHVNPATSGESWITVGDYTVTGFRGDVTLARVRWS